MQYITHCLSPLGPILLASNGKALTGLWFEGQKYFARTLDAARVEVEEELPVFYLAQKWLGLYFSGKKPAFSVPLLPAGTDFQKEVWALLLTIPYGATTTYGRLARRLAENRGLPHMSAQAVGGAVGHNPISILIPCHRVVGANGSLTGYAGGVERKRKLLALESANGAQFFVP